MQEVEYTLQGTAEGTTLPAVAWLRVVLPFSHALGVCLAAGFIVTRIFNFYRASRAANAQ